MVLCANPDQTADVKSRWCEDGGTAAAVTKPCLLPYVEPTRRIFHRYVAQVRKPFRRKTRSCPRIPAPDEPGSSARIVYLSGLVSVPPVLFASPGLHRDDICISAWPEPNVSPVLFASRCGHRVVVRAVLKTAALERLGCSGSAETACGCTGVVELEDGDLVKATGCSDETTASTQPDGHGKTPPFERLQGVAVAVKFIRQRGVSPPSTSEQDAIRREILCNIRLRSRIQKLKCLIKCGTLTRRQRSVLGWRDAHVWQPTAQLVGYHLNTHEPQKCVLVTSLVWGVDLGQWLEVHAQLGSSLKKEVLVCDDSKTINPRLTLSRSSALIRVWIAVLVLRRVFQLHETGIRHNDLKPSNVMVDLYPWKEKREITASATHNVPLSSLRDLCAHAEHVSLNDIDVRIIDLGNATPCEFQKQTGGTPAYLSPEQLLMAYNQRHRHALPPAPNAKTAPSLPLDQRTDLWSLGLTIVELLTVVTLTQALQGARPLKYLGAADNALQGWSVVPEEYIQFLYKGFFRENTLNSDAKDAGNDGTHHTKRCMEEAARQIFASFVQYHPDARKSIEDGILALLECALQLQGINPHDVLKPYRSTSPTQLPAWVDAVFMGHCTRFF